MRDNPRNAELERRLEAWDASQSDAELHPETHRVVTGLLASPLTPVKPLPSQGRLVLSFLVVFATCAAGLIAVMDKAGFHLMTVAQMGCMAAILAGGGVLFSLAVAWRMVPGSRQSVPLPFALALSGFGVIGGIALLFPWRTSHAFVSEGWPCAAMELMIAVPAAVVFWLLARRGALFGGAGVGAAAGGLAVMLALAVLQFQCMFQQAPHLLVWHGGTAAILIGLGAVIAWKATCARRNTMNLDQLNERQQETWTSGDFPKMGVELAITGELLCEGVPVYAGDRVLDVGTASGNTALAAARRRARVTAIDLVPSLLKRARQRASAEGLTVDFQEGDAMALAFPDASFDVVMSTFGAIFAPDPNRTAAEMARVCRPGGKVALAVWTPDGMLGKLFRLLARYAPPELALDAPIEWGEQAKYQKRLGLWSSEIAVQRQAVYFRALSAEHWVEFMKACFGPAIRAFGTSTPTAQTKLAEEMADLISEFNGAGNGTILARSEYLEIVATMRV